MNQTNLPAVLDLRQDVQLPDKGVWINRFEIKSESSANIYVVAQHKHEKYWGCSCPAWCIHRECKHLRAIGLPGNQIPYEPVIER